MTDISDLIKRAQQGDIDAKFELADEYMHGIHQDFGEAAKLYLDLAKKGYPKAQNMLGVILKDYGGMENEQQALYWFKEAAEQDDAQGQYNLGTMYDEGIAVIENPSEAKEWYCKSAKQDYAFAQLALGKMYAEGRGIDENPIYAYFWFVLATANGNEDVKSDARLEMEHMEHDEQITEKEIEKVGQMVQECMDGSVDCGDYC